MFASPNRHARQRGMYSVVIALLVGLSLSAGTLGLQNGIVGNGEKTRTLKVTTDAQGSAWSGVELVRDYVRQLDESALIALRGSPVRQLGHGLSVEFIHVEEPENASIGFDIEALIRASTGDASSALHVVFHRIEPHVPTAEKLPNGVVIDNDFRTTGGISVKGAEQISMSVDGNVKIENSSLTRLYHLEVNGDVSIGGNVRIESLRANGNVTLSGSAAVQDLRARGSVTLLNNSHAGDIWANGDVKVLDYSTVGAHADSMSGSGTIRSGGNVVFQGDRRVTAVTALGDVSTDHTSIATLVAGGEFRRTGRGCVNGEARGQLIVAPAECWRGEKVTRNPTLRVPFEPVPEVRPARAAIDAWPLRAYANYVFTLDALGRQTVRVKEVAGLSDGTYYLYDKSASDKTQLCKVPVGTDGNCAEVNQAPRICLANHPSHPCILYADGKWTLEAAKAMTAGVLWFEGDVQLSQGDYSNTIIATGNIRVTNAIAKGLNVAGYAAVCTNVDSKGIPRPLQPLYPSNFCDIAAGTLTPQLVGNIGLLAGGFSRASGGALAFRGGDITVDSSATLGGNVMAGNQFRTIGHTTLHGYLTVAGQGEKSEVSWDNTVMVDLTELPEGVDLTNTLCTVNCGDGAVEVSLRWARYP